MNQSTERVIFFGFIGAGRRVAWRADCDRPAHGLRHGRLLRRAAAAQQQRRRRHRSLQPDHRVPLLLARAPHEGADPEP